MNDASAEDEDDDVCGGADGILDAIGGEVHCDPVSGFTHCRHWSRSCDRSKHLGSCWCNKTDRLIFAINYKL